MCLRTVSANKRIFPLQQQDQPYSATCIQAFDSKRAENANIAKIFNANYNNI